MTSFFMGLIIGFLIVIPIGPVNILVIKTALNKNISTALSVGFASSFMDFIYFIVILSGLSFIDFNENFIFAIKVFGSIFLFVIGFLGLRPKKIDVNQDLQLNKKYKKRNYFMLGVFLYISNPTIVAGLSTICATIKSYEIYPDILFYNTLLSIGIGIGASIWYVILAKTIRKYRHRFTNKILILVNQTCAVLLILAAFYLSYNVYKDYFLSSGTLV